MTCVYRGGNILAISDSRSLVTEDFLLDRLPTIISKDEGEVGLDSSVCRAGS